MVQQSLTYRDPQALVQTAWLVTHLNDANLRIFDCTTHLLPADATFHARPRPGLFVGKEQVLASLHDPKTVSVNALMPELHRGDGPSRYGRAGRIPGSMNVPAATLLDPQTKAFVPLDDAQAKFQAVGIEKEKQVIAYCGGGISATVDLFLLHQLGYENLTLYDGSMGEWAKDETLPIEKG